MNLTHASSSIRRLATNGDLATIAADASPEIRSALYREALGVAWPLVFQHHTTPLERRRGHPRCARTVADLEPGCHDRFLDDLLAVVDYVLAYAKSPILNLEGWITTRIAAAVVDGHRRRRGSLGAQQRPRVPTWLVGALEGDAWLVELARMILEWVGVSAVAGAEAWPLGAWAEARAVFTGEWCGSGSERVVRAEVDAVCATMRGARPVWYQRYVERPLVAKERAMPYLCADVIELSPVDTTTDSDQELIERAGLALDIMASGTAAGADPAQVVSRALRRVFPSGCDGDTTIAAALDDPCRASRITTAVLEILSAETVAVAS